MTEHSRTHPLGAPAGARPASPGTVAPLETCVHPRAGDAPVVEVSGELDIATADLLRDVLIDAIARYGPDVVVDASGIRFCDACGVGAIVHAANHARRGGGTLTLINTSPRLTRLLRIVGLESPLTAPARRTP